MSDAEERMQRDPDDALDRALRSELRWEAPPELTLRLLSMVTPAPEFDALVHAVRPKPKPWVATLALMVTAIVIGVSLAISWQLYGIVGAQLGVSDIGQQFVASLQGVYDTLPFLRYIIEPLSEARDQLLWLLLAAVLWLALDGWSPNMGWRGQQQTS